MYKKQKVIQKLLNTQLVGTLPHIKVFRSSQNLIDTSLIFCTTIIEDNWLKLVKKSIKSKLSDINS